jgi:hypothetical protein
MLSAKHTHLLLLPHGLPLLDLDHVPPLSSPILSVPLADFLPLLHVIDSSLLVFVLELLKGPFTLQPPSLWD